MAEFDLMDLIASPIVAMNEAEAGNARRFVELLDDYAFDADPTTGARSLRHLEFTFERTDPNGGRRTDEVRIPLIQFMPIGGVSINEAVLSYALKVNPQLESDSVGRMRVLGNIAEDVGTDSPLSGNVNIEIRLKQIDLPSGVLNLLQTAQGGMVQRPTPGDDDPPDKPTPLPSVPDKFATVQAFKFSPRILEPGQDHVATFDLVLDDAVKRRGDNVAVQLSSRPSAALEFEGNDAFVLAGDQILEVPYLASPRIDGYADRTSVKLVMDLSTTSAGSTKELQLEFPLQRTRVPPDTRKNR